MQPSPPPSGTLAVVPFSWEEKPGVPRKQDSNNALLLSICIPPPSPLLLPQNPIAPAASQPPYLQRPPLRKVSSFPSAPFSPPPFPSPLGGVLVRKQSFDSRLLYHASNSSAARRRPRPVAQKVYSHGSLPEHDKRCLRRWMEEDPFFMAIQVCRQEPAGVVYNERRRTNAVQTRQLEVDGVEQLMIRDYFTQQSQEDDCLHINVAQKQPLIIQKKQCGGLCKFLAKCLAC